MRYTLVLLSLFCGCAVAMADSPADVEHLRCEYRINPLGIDILTPRLSWEMRDARRGARQTAYQVLVATTADRLAADRGDLWDSGKIPSDQSAQIVYAGKPLESRTACYWKVRIWDSAGQPTAFSSPAIWTMGLLTPADVKGHWIGMPGSMVHPLIRAAAAHEPTPPSFEGCPWIWTAEPGADATRNAPEGVRYFRKTLDITADKKIRQAQLVITADDIFSAYINGRSACWGTDWKVPQATDVTEWLTPGKNILGIAVKNTSQSSAGLLGKLIVEFQDSLTMIVPIDASWKSSRKPDTNWKAADFDDSKWPKAVEIAKMGDQPWGKVIVQPKAKPQACPLLRKEFKTAGNVRRATLYASALGNYRFYINGRPVGDDYFTPDWTDYNKRVYYNTYDVTELVRSNSANAIGGVLAAGWYAGAIGWGGQRNHYGEKPWLFAQLEIELADGTVQTVATDNSWKASYGPYIEGEFLAGEAYDATRETPDWDQAGFGDEAWSPVAVNDSARARFQAFPGVTVQQTGQLPTVAVTEPKPNVYVFDLGQNLAGFARLKARGPAGTRIQLRFAEVLNPDGTIYVKNLRGARAIDTYVLRGKGDEVWQPRFTFHGFRYVEVTGYPGRPTPKAITGIAINSDIPLTGQFECSSPTVNRLYQNIVWTQRANFISVPTDCPQRDERLGWTGDAQVFCRAATYNADVAAFFTKWLVDLEDAQGPTGDFPDVAPRVVDRAGGVAAWADAGTICPCTLFWVYNDRQLLERHFGAMQRWIDYCQKNSHGLLRPDAGFGDWLSIDAETPKDVLATAYFAESTRLTAKAARILNRPEDAEKYERLFREIRAAFNKAYVAADGRIKGNTQTCYVLALAFDLLSPENRAAATRYLVEDIRSRGTRLSTGFVGTGAILPVLTEVGQTPLAYELFLSDRFPSWGFSIKHGATSIWERWDGWTPEKGFQDPGMNSFAHYAFGAVGQWMFRTVVGIDTAEPGFQKLLLRPQPGRGLDWVKASYHSHHGPIRTEWRKANGQLFFTCAIPANTSAVVCLPTSELTKVREGGRTLQQLPEIAVLDGRAGEGETRLSVKAGTYHFTMPWTE
mgnify:CR=1 FL=1